MRLACAAAACVFLLAACQRADDAASSTRVLGSSSTSSPEAPAVLRDAYGEPIPAPTVPRQVQPHYTLVTDTHALALWVEDGRVMSTRYRPYAGWEPATELEAIDGRASLARIASNQRGVAMAVWRHSVGQIDSLRYSRWEEGRGWSRPDVLSLALPRAPQPGKSAGRAVDASAPQIEVDGDGNARAQWLSGYDEKEVQVSTYVRSEGWSRPLDLPLQARAGAAEAPAPSAR